MIATNFNQLQNCFNLFGATTYKYDLKTKKFKPKLSLLIYSVLTVVSHQIFLLLNHGNIVISTKADQMKLKDFLYKYDATIWWTIVCLFMFDTIIIKHWKSAQVISKLVETDECYGIYSCSYQADTKVKRAFKIMWIATGIYMIFSLALNSIQIRTEAISSSPVVIRMAFATSSTLFLTPKNLFETFFLLKMQYSFEGLTKNIKALKYKEQLYSIFEAFGEYFEISSLIEGLFKSSLIIQMLAVFTMFVFNLFYGFDAFYGNAGFDASVNMDHILSSLVSTNWNLIFLPFLYNCYLYGKIQFEVSTFSNKMIKSPVIIA